MDQLWFQSHRADPRALPLADAHYNRQKIGSPQFVPPGSCFVLLTEAANALWVTSWPKTEYVKHAWAGAWMNSTFRNESGHLSSMLIRQAVAATRAHWPTVPELGMVTFVDAGKVRRKRDPGRCYRRAGFKHVGFTKSGLWAFQLALEDMPEPSSAETTHLCYAQQRTKKRDGGAGPFVLRQEGQMATAQTDVLTASRQGMEQRLEELKPLVDEYQRLERAVVALDNIELHAGNGTASTKQATTRVKAATKPRATPKASIGARGRPKGTGKRGAEVIAVVTANPGLKVAQIAERIGLKPNYLYRVLPDLATQGKVVKGEDSGWFPVESDATVQ